MLADQITLSVDAENNGTPAPEVFTRYEEFQNRATYITGSHTPDARNQMSVYRTFPTRSGNFKGVEKTALKFTEDTEVAGVDSASTLKAPSIAEIAFSFPVGATAAFKKHMRQRVIAALDDDTLMDALNVQLMI